MELLASDFDQSFEARVEELRRDLLHPYHPPEDWAAFDRDERVLRSKRVERENLFARVLFELDRAEELGADADVVRGVRAELFAERWRLARAAGDRSAEKYLRQKLVGFDREGRYADELAGEGELRLVAQEAGSHDELEAELHLFRYAERGDLVPGDERRQVPVPIGGPSPALEPGTWCLRVVRAASGIDPADLVVEVAGWPIEGVVLVAAGPPPLARGDRLVAIDGAAVRDLWTATRQGDGGYRAFAFERRDGTRRELVGADLEALGVEVAEPRALAEAGGVDAVLVREDARVPIELPPGLVLRTTAAPLALGPSSLVGEFVERTLTLPAGLYLCVGRAPGRELARAPFIVSEGGWRSGGVRFLSAGTTPPGLVAVASCHDHRPLWFTEAEVTCGEYLAFLNDPDTLAEVDASAAPTRYPREAGNAVAGGYWPRGEDGRFRLPEGWSPGRPVLGVSFRDARAYAAWRDARARDRGEPFTWRLPTLEELTHLHFTPNVWPYLHGDAFRPQLFQSCNSRAVPCVEPVMSYPADESPHGAFDVMGGSSEWCDEWFDRSRRQRYLVGGAWAYGEPVRFAYAGLRGDGEDAAEDTYGFRLVAEQRE